MLIKAGEIIGNSWQYYAENFKKLIPYMVFLFVPNFVLGLAGIASLYIGQYATTGAFVLTNNIIALAVFVACIIFTLWVTMALAKNLGLLVTKKSFIGYKESFSITSHLIWPVIYTSLLVVLIVMGGTILFVIPGIIFSIWYGFTYYTILFEEKRGVAALSASKSLVSGRWWKILWRLLAPGLFYAVIFFILISAVTSILKMIMPPSFAFLVVNGVLNSILSSLVSPLTALTTVLLYFSAKDNPVLKSLTEVKK